MTWYVLDSYALLASYHRELGGTRVDQLLLDPGNNHWISVINLGEVYYRVAKDNGFQQARQTLTWIGSLPIRMVDADWPLTRAAAQIKGKYALSYADCFAVALAQEFAASVVTGDPEFRKPEEDGIVHVEWISAKPKRARR